MIKNESFITKCLANESEKYQSIEFSYLPLSEEFSGWLEKPTQTATKRSCEIIPVKEVRKPSSFSNSISNFPLISNTNKSQNLKPRKLSRNIRISDIDPRPLRNIFRTQDKTKTKFNAPNRMRMYARNKEKITRLTVMFKNHLRSRSSHVYIDSLSVNSIPML